ncbi:hypothetical protein [Stakelama tenebrarum]|uniref:Uncharacterized protein n=1 Tax=Stakelama tenebrarum TaxID=2711215 RepID=A0A6G6Y8Z6_9SPHN|nr:hypothetical protein [Sphingosinithalassobacter tenebrarum]QIG81277.1 hypothetical protein G5C33_16815 [Sphingosinithalassobacter tenebrarum]
MVPLARDAADWSFFQIGCIALRCGVTHPPDSRDSKEATIAPPANAAHI